MSAVVSVGAASFQRDVLDASESMPVVVDFWAPWCGPCRTLGPILETVADTLAGQARIVKVNSDQEQQLAARFQIRSIPTVMLFSHGKLAAQFTGVQPEAAIREWIRPFLTDQARTGQGPSVREQAAAARSAGDSAQARALLKRHLEDDASDVDALLELASLEVAAGHAADAHALLGRVPPERRDDPRALAIDAQLCFADELEQVQGGTSDLDQLYAEGLRAALRGAAEPAAEDFLALTQRSRAYRDDAGRRSLVTLCAMLGDEDPRTQDYRRRLARLLH